MEQMKNDVSDYVNLLRRKKEIATEKLKARHCKEQLRNCTFIPSASSVCDPFVALHTARRYSASCQTFCNKAAQFLQLLFVFDSSSC
jgi:hypothetical protein